MTTTRKKTRFKSIEATERRIRRLESHCYEYKQICDLYQQEKIMLAKLAATGPAFFNPLDAMEAEKLRDKLLRSVRINPDGTFID